MVPERPVGLPFPAIRSSLSLAAHAPVAPAVRPKKLRESEISPAFAVRMMDGTLLFSRFGSCLLQFLITHHGAYRNQLSFMTVLGYAAGTGWHAPHMKCCNRVQVLSPAELWFRNFGTAGAASGERSENGAHNIAGPSAGVHELAHRLLSEPRWRKQPR